MTPPSIITVTFCATCGRVGCAFTSEDRRRENIAPGGTCEFCPPRAGKTSLKRWVKYERHYGRRKKKAPC